MQLLGLIGITLTAGAIGGAVNALMTQNGFIFPRTEPADGTPTASKIWRPGFLGNVIIGAMAALVSWGLYGPLAKEALFADKTPAQAQAPNTGSNSASDPVALYTLATLVGALLVGTGGAKWLTDAVDKQMLKAAASNAAAKQSDPTLAQRIGNSSPIEALRASK